MNIEYKLSRKEYREFLKTTYQRVARIGKGNIKFFSLNIVTWVFFGVAIAALLTFFRVYHWIDFMHLDLALLFLGIGTVWLIGVFIYQRRFYMHYSLDDNGYLLHVHNASITEDAIIVTTGDVSASYYWSAFQGKEISKNLVCLYIDNGQAVIFPQRAFQSEDQLEEFISLIDSKIK